MKPTVGRIVIYRTDGRNGLAYDLPAIVTCTRDTHPGPYPDGSSNPLPVPDEGRVHLTVFTPGGFGSTKVRDDTGAEFDPTAEHTDDSVYVGATSFVPGSGTYVEWNVQGNEDAKRSVRDGTFSDDDVLPRTWRWPERVGAA